MNDQQDSPGDSQQETTETRKKSLKRSWASSGPVAKLTCVFAGIAALATVAYTLVAVVTLYVMSSGQQSGTQQTWAAIGNLNWMAKNADESLKKLSMQARDTHDLAVASREQAEAAKTANEHTADIDRPWLGATLSVEGFDVGKTPVATVVFANTGRRPAKVLDAEVQTNWFERFPSAPPTRLKDSIAGAYSYPTKV